MTVVVNGRFLNQPAGGLQRTARSLLVALRAGGLDLEVVAPVPDPLADVVRRAPAGRGGGQVWEQLLLPRHAAGRRVLSLANTSPLVAARSTVLVHDLAPLVGPEWFVPSMRAYGRLVLAGARRADTVVAVSHAVAAELQARGVAVAGVVHPAVDPLFRPAPASDVSRLRAALGLTRPYVVLPGWADPRKDTALAVAAHLAVLARRPHDLVLTGAVRGVFRPVTLPDAPSVRRAGQLTDSDLAALYTGAAALLYPSRYEGFGLPPAEALACGTPALVADLPVLRESNGHGPRYLPTGDVDRWAQALCEVLSEPRDLASRAPVRSWADAAVEFSLLLNR